LHDQARVGTALGVSRAHRGGDRDQQRQRGDQAYKRDAEQGDHGSSPVWVLSVVYAAQGAVEA